MKPKDQEKRNKILTGNIWSLMFTMSLPAIIAMSINGINTFVDGLFVGQYIGLNALAAVSLVLPLTIITSGIASLIGIGSASLLSISIGNGNEEIQSKVLGTVTILSLIFSALLTLLGWVYAYELLAMMGGTGEIQELGVIYYRIILLGSFFRIHAVAINMLIRAEGKVAEAMTYSIIATLINIILNYIFLAVFGWGVEGAAWSTVIAMVIFSLFNFWYFYIGKRASYKIDFSKFSLNKELLRPIFSVGFSGLMLQVMFFIQQVIVFRSIAHYGNDYDLTFMGSSYRIMLLVILPGYGFAQALQPIVGINYGAKLHARVKESFHKFMVAYTVFLLGIWGVVIFFPTTTLGWMMPNTNFSETDIFNYQIMMSCLPLYPYFLMATTLFQGTGEGKLAAILLIAREVIFFIPLVLLLPRWYGISGIYSVWLPVSIAVLFVSIWMVDNHFRKFSIA